MSDGVVDPGLPQALVLHPHPLEVQVGRDELEGLVALRGALAKVQICRDKSGRSGGERLDALSFPVWASAEKSGRQSLAQKKVFFFGSPGLAYLLFIDSFVFAIKDRQKSWVRGKKRFPGEKILSR